MVGKGNMKNNYVFQLPIYKIIYGNCCLISKSNGILIDLNENMWIKVCNKLNKVTIIETEQVIEPIQINTNDSKNEDSKNEDINNEDSKSEDCESEDNEKDMDDEYDIDSELKEESYIYSSEEEDR